MIGTPTLTRSQILLLELVERLGDKADDKTKLAKLQYFSDFIHYAFHNKPISEEENIYEKRGYGPLARNFNDDLKALCHLDFLEKKGKYHYILKSKPKYKPLSSEERKTIDFVISRYGNSSWHELVKISHKQIPYLSAAGEGSIVEYFTAFNLLDEYPEYADFSHA